MPRAKLRVTVPDGVWIGDISRRHAAAEFRILAALAAEGSGVGLAEVTSESLAAVLADLRESEAVVALDVLERREETALVQFETTVPLLLLAVQDSGIPLEMPFVIVDGEATWELVASRDRLSTLGDRLEEFGIPFVVEEIRQKVGDAALLTDRQERVLVAAVEAGYYDTPRQCTLTELADELGVAKSTCSETLHRAEERVVKQFVEDRETAPEVTGN